MPEPAHSPQRDRARDRDRDRERDRERDRDPSQHSKRLSITDRILGSLNQARKETSAAVQRRTSTSTSTSASASAKQSPIPRIREWLSTCNTQHGRHCSGTDSRDALTWRPIHLIDCDERCLVRSKPADRYSALSYVWGVSNPRDTGSDAAAQLLTTNLDAYQLSLPDKGVPKTILDAMWLSRKLGIRYLWVDRMCIVQDDEQDKSEHIEHMAYVFANACLTIISAYGDVHTGLLPLDPRRPSRAPRQGNPDHHELLLSSKWNTRGWTLQELVYSRRAVFFFEDAVTWECHCDLWQGNATNMTKILRGKKPACTNRLSEAAFAFQHTEWPDMDEYARLAMDYSMRRVTIVDDSIRAFTGVTHVLSRIFQGGFAYGMPLMFIDIALLWRPQATIRRRAMSRPPFLPSWSWMGWWFDGIPVDLTLWRAAADYVEETQAVKRGQESKRFKPTHPFRIKTMVAWSLSDRANSAPIDNTGLRMREFRSRKGAGQALPPGWSKSGSHFKHDSDDLTLFKYPVPVQDVPEDGLYESRPTELSIPGPLLYFRTTTAFFDVDYAISMAPKDMPNPPVAIGNIFSRSNRWIGELRSHDGWLGVQSSNYDGEEKLEFIAISSAMERKGSYVFPMDRFSESMDDDGVVQFVNVLWIERISGVAYRRGIGHILQKAWDVEAKEEVGIYLG